MTKAPKVLAINGSHRSERGFTEIVLKKFLKGVDTAHVHCEVLYPSKKKIASCVSCGKCLFETPGECMHDDDMAEVIAKMEEADVIVFASPVYFDSMTSNMQKMIERLRVVLDAFFEFRNGRTYHLSKKHKSKKVVTIFTAGNPEQETFTSISRIFNRITDNMGWQGAGEIRFPASHLLVAEPELLSEQLEAVAMCGQEIVSDGAIRTETLDVANREYIDDPEATVRHMTQTILKMREENQRF